MRALQGEAGAFTFAISEFVRVNQEAVPKKVFLRYTPELLTDGLSPTGLPVQVQLLGGDANRMAESAVIACEAGAQAIDINFGCPAPTVNRNDGGATLLKYPKRIREIVSAIRAAVPKEIPVSAKMRLGWDTLDAIYENAEMAAEGGASWLTIHGRTRVAGYAPPAHWEPIGQVRERLGIPVVANGDIWTLQDFRRCREATGCRHFMLGRGAMANPLLPRQIARELGLLTSENEIKSEVENTTEEGLPLASRAEFDWAVPLQRLIDYSLFFDQRTPDQMVRRLKQWLKMADQRGNFCDFDAIKRLETAEELFAVLKA